MKIRQFKVEDTEAVSEIWNSVVKEGIAFPQMNMIEGEEATRFFES